MKVREDEAYRAFLGTPDEEGWTGTRIKSVRHREIRPGGRVVLTMFAPGGDPDGRPHPRMQVRLPAARDPDPPGTMFAPAAPPAGVDELRAQIRQALGTHQRVLTAADLDPARAPQGSRRYWKNSIRVQRIAHFFSQVRQAVDGWLGSALSGTRREEALRAVREIEDEVYATDLRFDEDTIGTYYSYRGDEPFVHYMEMLLASLPEEGSDAFALLPSEAQYAVRRQRQQLRNHLDFIMRHKYAYRVVDETDIERTVGGMLIDRDRRMIVSEARGTGEAMVPRYELLRIEPNAPHPNAGAWVYRDGQGDIRLQDGTRVRVREDTLRATPVSTERLTFRRMPGSARLRPGMRLDWNEDGAIEDGRIDWVSWAGHCDVQGVMEGLGITLSNAPRLEEYRSDSDAVTIYDRSLLLEMIASAIELGSVYRRVDGSGLLRRGRQRFGGARNDQLPDRLQLQVQDGHFRWPLIGRKDALEVTAIYWPGDDGTLEQADMGTVFFRYLPDLDALDFAPNPRFIETVEGDYNVIDVTGALIEAEMQVDTFDESSGYAVKRRRTTVIDLRPEADGERFFLGTYVEDPARRRVYRVYLDRRNERIVAALDVYEQRDGMWLPRTLDEESIVLPLTMPLRCTLSREMRRDQPEVYQNLLETAFREGEYICADTDKEEQVWNGVVTRMVMRKVGENRAARVERWRVDVEARFGNAVLDYLMRRNEAGEPVAYCPAVDEGSSERWVDFLWQDFPDVGSKGYENGDWIVNATMLERRLIEVVAEPSMPGGVYVYDDHVKNLYEMIYAALSGYPYSIVHGNKRYGFESRSAWQQAVTLLQERRSRLSFE